MFQLSGSAFGFLVAKVRPRISGKGRAGNRAFAVCGGGSCRRSIDDRAVTIIGYDRVVAGAASPVCLGGVPYDQVARAIHVDASVVVCNLVALDEASGRARVDVNAGAVPGRAVVIGMITHHSASAQDTNAIALVVCNRAVFDCRRSS